MQASDILIICPEHMAWAGIRSQLHGIRPMRPVTSRRDVEDAVATAERLQCPLIMVATSLPGITLPCLAADLNARCPGSKVLIIGDLLPDAERDALDDLHVQAYVTWEDLREGTIRRLVRHLLEDDLLVASRSVVARMREAWRRTQRAQRSSIRLSSAERAVLQVLLDGSTVQQVSTLTGIPYGTVKRIVADLHDRLEAPTLFALGAKVCTLDLLA